MCLQRKILYEVFDLFPGPVLTIAGRPNAKRIARGPVWTDKDIK